MAAKRPDLHHPFQCDRGRESECSFYHDWLGGKVKCALPEHSPIHQPPYPQPNAPEKRTAACYPTPEEINVLPDKVRQYIHDLETRTDKSGDVQTMALLREDLDALQKRVEELEAELARWRA
jgi:hypothetical protein